MFGKIYDPGITPNELVAGSRVKPFDYPDRKSLIERNSFPSVNENRHLTKIINDINARKKPGQ